MVDVKYSIVLIVYGVYRVKEKREIGTTVVVKLFCNICG